MFLLMFHYTIVGLDALLKLGVAKAILILINTLK